MPTMQRIPLVVDALKNAYGNDAMSHDTVEVTVTASMGHGSVLKADLTEVADAADAANGTMIIDDLGFDTAGFAVGDTVGVRVLKANAKARVSVMKYADGATATEAALTGLDNSISFE
ncbi:putative head stabilization/decoration protein [Pseudoalteromonas phage J2-1_QLiu-2017]|nr:putative head stabilization/decoration protein [Pseudoalteromonas phage J2-1_QLiu-2017]